MTIQEFDKTGWTGEMEGIYKKEIFDIASVDFEEKLIGLLIPCNELKDDFELTWVRCENVKLIKK